MTICRWAEVPDEKLNERVSRQVLHTASMTMARITLLKGAIVPVHHHVSEQILTLNSGRLVCRMAGEEIVLGPGETLEIPPNLPHSVEALEDSIALDVFAPRREDWIRGDDAYLRR